MAYNQFVPDKPVISDTGGQVIDAIRQNLMALRDAVLTGAMVGWSMAQTGANAEQPDTITYANGVERIRLTITWGSSGGALGQPTIVVYDYSGNSGTSWDSMGTVTSTFDSGGNMTAQSWS